MRVAKRLPISPPENAAPERELPLANTGDLNGWINARTGGYAGGMIYSNRTTRNTHDQAPRTITSLFTVLIASAVWTSIVCSAPDDTEGRTQRPPLSANASELLTRAGNSDSDAERLGLLRKLYRLDGLDPELRMELDVLLPVAEKWVESPFLPFFWREFRDSIESDLGISSASHLYPLRCLYRGRMLVWNTLEMGNIIRNPALRRQFLDQAVADFKVALAAFPKNRILRMYLGEPIAWEKPIAVPKRAPRWAALQRENLERLSDIIVWWIEKRMQPDGQYGGGWGDDCEMWRWWAPVLLGFDHPQISSAQARFSAALMSQPHMERGYTTRMTDVEHTAEDSADAITPMMHLAPEQTEWRARALRLATLMEESWTGVNRRGFLQFRSTYFTVDKVDTAPERACDTVYHPRAVQPALLLWQRTGDPQLGSLFRRWMDLWVDAAARSERGKPAGIVPSAIHWPDGTVGGLAGNWWDPNNHDEPTLYLWPSALGMLNDTLLLTYHMTGDEKYLAPLRSMAAIRLAYLKSDPQGSPEPGSEPWCASRLRGLAGTLAKYRALTKNGEFDELLEREGLTLTAGERFADRVQLEEELVASAKSLRTNFAGYTSEVRWTDRVLRFPALFGENMMFPGALPGFPTPNPGLLYRLVTGDPGSAGYFPLNAVRWRTPPKDIAVLVTHSETDRFAAELFHFGASPRPMVADLYLLARGSYTLTLTAAARAVAPTAELLRRDIDVTGPVTRLSFELPPQRLAHLVVETKP